MLVATSAFMTTLAILASASRDQSGQARASAMTWIFGWLLVPPVVSMFPIPSGSFWGDLLIEIRQACSFVAPSSPVSLLTDRAWFYRPEASAWKAAWP